MEKNFDDWEKFFNFVTAFANTMLFSMRGILVFVIGFVMLAAAVSCGDAHYDARLAAIDSIIEERPDSALAGLRAMGFGAFSRSDDRAYFALLLTEAQYKCYDSIASTDTIDLAVNHFTGNGDREKLTRSLIFKGATLEELGNPTDAMRFYKQAEETALSTDYHNLGYANLRMATLYNNQFDVDCSDLDKYKFALKCFEKNQNLNYQMVCKSAIGILYINKDNDSAFRYTTETIDLAKRLQNQYFYYNSLSILSSIYYQLGNYDQAKELAKNVALNIHYLDNEKCYYIIAKSYCKLGKRDSALIVKELLREPKNKEALVDYYSCMSDLAAVSSQHDLSVQYALKASELSGELLVKSLQSKLRSAESIHNENVAALKIAKANRNIIILCLFLAVAALLVLAIFTIMMQIRLKLKSKENIIKSLQIDCQNFINIINDYDNKTKHKTYNYNRKIESYISLIKELTSAKNTCKKIENSSFEKIKEMLLLNISNKEDFWSSLKEILDNKYNGVITKIEKENILSDSDIHILCLIGFGFSNASIALLANYSNAHSISNRKHIIAEKLCVNDSLYELFVS